MTRALLLRNAVQRQRSGDLIGAERLFRQVLTVSPNDIETLVHLGTLLQIQGRHTDAVDLLVKAIGLKPNLFVAHNSLGVSLAKLGKLDAAAESLQRAIALQPDLPDLHINLGNIRRTQKRFDLAVESYQAALRIDPRNAEAHNLLGTMLAIQGRLPEAIARFEEALRLVPNDARAHSNLLLAMNYLPDVDPVLLFAEHTFWGRLHGGGMTRRRTLLNSRNPTRKLRVGYVLPDFRVHAAAQFIEPILAHHDADHRRDPDPHDLSGQSSLTRHSFRSAFHRR